MDSNLRKLAANTAIQFGATVLLLLVLLAMLAPWLGTVDPSAMDFSHINAAAGTTGTFTALDGTSVSHTFWMGSDSVGRDIFSRLLYGTRVSLLVGLFTALVALLIGGFLGMLAGFFKTADAILMRLMDGLMAIPAILLAIALVAALGAQVWTVVVAIAVPEIPRVTRLIRSLVLTLREEPFVEAARALATPTPTILWRHILPNASAPLIVQGTFIAASAVLTEAILSFLGLGLPADVPTWGNIMAEGRVQFTQYPGNVLFPALFLVPTVLAINMVGDGLRDVLDPKFAKRGK
jgi:peptide/nickel transport system permease protein